ncbi:MAG: ATP-binding protein [Gemmatimonadota bacterium]
MKQLVVLSGKGGTGKTAVTAAFVHLTQRAGGVAVAVDADVDAANLEILVGGERFEEHEFVGGVVARIQFEYCSGCGTCEEVCRFDAIRPAERWGFEVDPLACEGCAACFYQCPYEAIELVPRVCGVWYRSSTRAGRPFFHARLRPAQENSGRLVALIREKARTAATQGNVPLIIVDGPPGIGCPAIAASTGADLALIVTEPTVAGLHDLRRALAMTAHFELDRVVCINKHDLHPAGTAAIEAACADLGVEVVGSIPFDEEVPAAMAEGRAVTELHPVRAATAALEGVWEQVQHRLNGHAARTLGGVALPAHAAPPSRNGAARQPSDPGAAADP